MTAESSRKVVRSHRLVFVAAGESSASRAGVSRCLAACELRLFAYWLVSLALFSLLARLPLFGAIASAAPASLRLLAMPIAAAPLLSRWEIDGRPPHRAVAGLLAWRLQARDLAGLRHFSR
jgi:hypothetical protein